MFPASVQLLNSALFCSALFTYLTSVSPHETILKQTISRPTQPRPPLPVMTAATDAQVRTTVGKEIIFHALNRSGR